MNGLLVVGLLLGSLALALLWRMLRQLRRGRILAGMAWSLQAMLSLLGFTLCLLLLSNLYTYQRLTHEQLLGEVWMQHLGPQHYNVVLELADRPARTFELRGDQWRLDIRFLKWKGWANLFGLDSYFQLDRLSGRFLDVEQARLTPPSVYDLRPVERGIDLFALKQELRERLPWVDAYYGQGVFLPLRDDARYRVTVGQQGLLVRPANRSAESAVVTF